MTDKELLELAAKAAGLDYIKNCVWVDDGFYSPLNKHERISWNPLTDDGDAFRLATKLGLAIGINNPFHITVVTDLHGNSSEVSHNEGGTAAATRRAIVRAAAEIGRTL